MPNPCTPFIKTQRPILQFLNQIVDQYGSIHCIRLTECQLTELEGIRKFREENIKENLCTPLIKKVIETFLSLVKKQQVKHLTQVKLLIPPLNTGTHKPFSKGGNQQNIKIIKKPRG